MKGLLRKYINIKNKKWNKKNRIYKVLSNEYLQLPSRTAQFNRDKRGASSKTTCVLWFCILKQNQRTQKNIYVGIHIP